jgi:hypothetical protein
MPTGYEVQQFHDISMIAESLKRIADALEGIVPTLAGIQDSIDRTTPKPKPRLLMSTADSGAIGDWLTDHGVPDDAR